MMAKREEAVWNLTLFLCLVWMATILYGEMLTYWVPSLWTCSWPHLGGFNQINRTGYQGGYVKVAVLADPQIMDKTSHGLAPKSVALEISQFYTDLFMRRAFLASVMPFKPDMILFLGDYFDGGPILSDEEWQESFSRFKHIFYLDTRERQTDIQVYYIPGNHDIGYAYLCPHKPEVCRRYEKEFGARNYRFTVGKVDFITIDAQVIDGNPKGDLTSACWDFVKNVSMDVISNSRVLLTHIPLYRPNGMSCGMHRHSPVINQRVSRSPHDQEIVYQNYITEGSSKLLLDLIRPVLVLSAHDHDQCTVTHMSKHGPVREQTVGTISWQQGNLYPSFMLLSVSNSMLPNNSSPEEAISSNLCFLPMQTHIYIWYLSLFLLTLLALLLWPANGFGIFNHINDLIGYLSRNFFRGGTKEKNEDENCEYEMIWDAEGSMHLIKKTLMVQSTCSSERVLLERGNVVMRATAKKQGTQDMEGCPAVDMNIDVGSDCTVKLPSKPRKSKTKRMILRMFRAFRMLTVIAAVNVPLYMMLLFKDWIGLTNEFLHSR